MSLHPGAGKKAPPESLVSIEKLVHAYHNLAPDPANPEQRVAFGTSGHRGNAFKASFNEAHVQAITQAICDVRQERGITGPLYMGLDTHALSAPAHQSALEVLAANKVTVLIHQDKQTREFLPTPTPVISFSILEYNRERPGFAQAVEQRFAAGFNNGLADGIVITPSHNPPADGGFKYNPPHGGPADTDLTAIIEKRANDLLAGQNAGVKRLDYAAALAAPTTRAHDYITPYVQALAKVVDMRAIADSGLSLAVDPLGGSSLPFWQAIAAHYKLKITITNPALDPSFSFMPLDHDGKIRMDCSSPWAMSGLTAQASWYDLAFGNDPDADRHGIVAGGQLMNPNHYLAVCVWYLLQHRPHWPQKAMIGKTLVTSALLDRVAHSLGREIHDVPVGFKWFVSGLLGGSCCFGGEESAGASFLRFDGSVWSTDKDGLILALLAAEITANCGRTPDKIYEELATRLGRPWYERKDTPASRRQKKALSGMRAEQVQSRELAGEPITGVFTAAPGNNAPIGGLKVQTANGWFAARPSGTEDIYKIYAESFIGPEHLAALQEEAVKLINTVLGE